MYGDCSPVSLNLRRVPAPSYAGVEPSKALSSAAFVMELELRFRRVKASQGQCVPFVQTERYALN